MVDQFSKPHFRIYVALPVVTHERYQFTEGGVGALNRQQEEFRDGRLKGRWPPVVCSQCGEIRKQIEERLEVFEAGGP